MNFTKLIAQSLYICSAIFGTSQIASAKELTPATPVRQIQVNPKLLVPLNGSLILNNKDLKIKLESIRTEGPRTGGGGNSCALSIASNTKTLQVLLSSEKYNLLSEKDLKQLNKAIDRAQFFLSTKLELNGQSKEAINYPNSGRIYISKQFCMSEMTQVSARAMALLLHEYMGLAGLDDRQYQISGAFLEKFSAQARDQDEVSLFLRIEAEKDLQGKPSCFGGKIFAFKEEMEDHYGARYRPHVDLSLAEAGSSHYRAPAKYCGEAKNGKKYCSTSDESTFAVTAHMGSSTSGTFETVAKLFKVTKEVNTTLLLDEHADWFPKEGHIFSEESVTNYSCQIVAF